MIVPSLSVKTSTSDYERGCIINFGDDLRDSRGSGYFKDSIDKVEILKSMFIPLSLRNGTFEIPAFDIGKLLCMTLNMVVLSFVSRWIFKATDPIGMCDISMILMMMV